MINYNTRVFSGITIDAVESIEKFNQQSQKKSNYLSSLFKDEYLISGLESSTEFIDELSDTYLQDQLKGSKEPEKRLNTLATAFCVEMFAMNTLKEFIDNFLAYRENYEEIRKNHCFGEIRRNNCLTGWSFDGEKINLKTSEGFAFYFRYFDELMEKGIRSIEDYKNLKKIVDQAGSEEVVQFASWLMVVYRDSRLSNIYEKTRIDLLRDLGRVNKYLKLNPIFQKIFGLSKTRMSIFHKANSFLTDVYREIVKINGKSHYDYPSNDSLKGLKEEFDQWHTTLDKRLVVFDKIIMKLNEIRSKKKNGQIQFLSMFLNHQIDFVPVRLTLCSEWARKAFFENLSDNTEKTSQESVSKTSNVKSMKQERVKEAKTVFSSNKYKKKHEVQQQNNTEQEVGSHEEEEVIEPQSPSIETKKEQANITPTILPKPFDYEYSLRVQDWFDEKPKQLDEENYCHLDGWNKFKQKVFHGFSRRVDGFISDYAFETSWLNETTSSKDRLFCIPGEIQFNTPFGKEVERGIFTFCLGYDNKIFHRYFTKKPNDELKKYANPIFRDVDFPPIEKAHLFSKNQNYRSVTLPSDEGDSIEYQPFLESIRILDRRHDVKIILYKTKKCDNIKT